MEHTGNTEHSLRGGMRMRLLKFLIIIIFSISGCSDHKRTIPPLMTEKPENTVTNLSKTLKCLGDNFKSQNNDIGLILVVRNIIDGTIRPESPTDGKLSDAGKQQLVNVLYEYLPMEHAIILDKVPPMFFNEYGYSSTTGVNEYGLPARKKMNNFLKFYLRVLNKRRDVVGSPHAKIIRFLYISGIFSSFDGDEFYSIGNGIEGGNDGTDAEGEIGIGRTSEARSITLIVNIHDVKTNAIIGTKSLTLTAYKTGTEYTFAIRGAGSKETSFGFANEELIVEGIHGAQKTLIDAMGIWLISKICSQTVMTSCLEANETHIINNDFLPHQFSGKFDKPPSREIEIHHNELNKYK